MSEAVAVRQESISHPRIAHSDDRGEIINVLAEPHVAVITSVEGSVRAGHWHPGANIQKMYLIYGRYAAASEEISADGALIPGTRRIQIVEAGQLATCPPYLAHAYLFMEDSLFLNINSQPREPEGFGKHTIPIQIRAPSIDEIATAGARLL